MSREEVLVDREHPLMALRRYELDEPLTTSNARRELEELIEEKADSKSHTWGYFPERSPDRDDYRENINLAQEIRKKVLEPRKLREKMNLELAFVRLATDEPESSYGGMHIDVNRGIGHQWPEDIDSSNYQVVRTLFNVGDYPRKLEYADITVEELREKYDLEISREQYEELDLPEEVPTETVKVPPLEPDTISCVIFISSMIPHAGRTGGQGHFLVSHGGYIEKGEVSQVLR